MWNVIGITDDQSVCDYCGKEALKRIVVMKNTETEVTMKVGTVCAANLQGIKKKEQVKKENAWLKQRIEAVSKIMDDMPEHEVYKNAYSQFIQWQNANPQMLSKEEILSKDRELIRPAYLAWKEKIEELKSHECKEVADQINAWMR